LKGGLIHGNLPSVAQKAQQIGKLRLNWGLNWFIKLYAHLLLCKARFLFMDVADKKLLAMEVI
jgi:hypothetical protein